MSNMFDIFDTIGSNETKIKPNIILRANFELGNCGTIRIYQQNGAKICCSFAKSIKVEGIYWEGLFENTDYKNKDTEPYERNTRSTHIVNAFRNLDEIAISDKEDSYQKKKYIKESPL